MRIIIIYFLLFIICLSCTNKNTILNEYFTKLDRAISKDCLIELSYCSEIDDYKNFIRYKANQNFQNEFKQIPQKLKALIADSFQITSDIDQQLFILIAFQKTKKNIPYNFKKIKNEIVSYYHYTDSIYSQRFYEEETIQQEIAEANFKKYNVGDTINLLYPVQKVGSQKIVYFNNFYYKKNYSDTLYISCILKSKRKEASINENKWKAPFFYLKIIKVKNRDIDLIDKKYSVGNFIELSLYIYGRYI